MRTGGSGRRIAVAVVSALAVLSGPGGVLGTWTLLIAAEGPTIKVDEWPRRYVAPDGATIVMYEPQVASWDRQKLLTAYAAVSYTPPKSDKALLGTIVAEADTRVSVEQRLVDFSSFRITRSNFPVESRQQDLDIVAAIKASMPLAERVIALDRVLSQIDASDIRPQNVEGVKADPPSIFYSTRPALMVNIDGAPVWSRIETTDLQYAVNTNWDMFEHTPTKTYYLRNELRWMKSSAPTGPWTAAGSLPASFGKLPADENWNDTRTAYPLRASSAAAAPAVFVSTTPAELILLRGEPQYEAVAGTTLLWIRNTESDVFRLGPTGPIYYLVAGRWFSAAAFAGPWTFATTSLPDDFKRIPLEHPRSRVLASVPGTAQAAEAILLSQVPQTARVSKKDVKPPEVAYQGAPQFEMVPATSVARAINTDKDIIKVGDLYYMCFEGVWFMSKAATGPWEVTGTVPKEIYEIPVSSPVHHVTYVTVEDDDDDWVVYAAAAGYTGMMVAWGCAVWGTGYYYPPYVYGGFYYPYFPTYGYSAWYNPWTGAYGRGIAAYGPYGGAGVGARYNPRTGTYARGAAAYGPYGARGAARAYNPRTGTSAATRQGAGVYGSWGTTGVQRGDQWARTSRVTNNFTGNTTRVTRGSEGGAAVTRRGPGDTGGFVGQSGSGDMYAGRDGNVYRKDSGGSWQKYENGSWNGVDQPTPQQRDAAAARAQERASGAQDRARSTDSGTIGQLDRDSTARSTGDQRSRDAERVRSGTGSTTTRSGSGSYRPSGGGFGGGGGGGFRGGGRRR